MSEVIIRDIEKGDHNFIISTWLLSYRHNSPETKRINSEVFYKHHQEIIKEILNRPTSQSVITALKDNPSVILGYFVTEDIEDKKVAHYCYVKKSFRQNGICKKMAIELFGPEIDTFTISQYTSILKDINKKYEYNPYFMKGSN